jgi:hypothetical protein
MYVGNDLIVTTQARILIVRSTIISTTHTVLMVVSVSFLLLIATSPASLVLA